MAALSGVLVPVQASVSTGCSSGLKNGFIRPTSMMLM